MKKLQDLGKALTKAEQKTVMGGLHHSMVPGGPGDMVTCYNTLWAYFTSDHPLGESGFTPVGSFSDIPQGENAIAYGFAAIIPRPAGC